jgi:hypothetical protein
MYTDEVQDISFKEFRKSEGELHMQLIKICRDYMSKLGIVSIIGILDIVEQEIIEFDKATRKGISGTELGLNDEGE